MEKAKRPDGWEVWFLGDTPEATADALCLALNDPQRGLGVLVVNAHGVRDRYGVQLARKTVWQGSGADLSDTDIVILPACSVGRLQQDGDRDVAGLCAELAASRGRTLVAARWPIADTETARFTQLLVDEYLAAAQAAKSDGGVLPLFARARAFRRALERAQADPDITFYLAAAFDLYGLG